VQSLTLLGELREQPDLQEITGRTAPNTYDNLPNEQGAMQKELGLCLLPLRRKRLNRTRRGLSSIDPDRDTLVNAAM